jgi:hypothetical protein
MRVVIFQFKLVRGNVLIILIFADHKILRIKLVHLLQLGNLFLKFLHLWSEGMDGKLHFADGEHGEISS